MHKSYFNWRGRKDAALALHYAIQNNISVLMLLTNVNAAYNRISMHGVRRTLLKARAKTIDIPPDTIGYPSSLLNKVSAIVLY